MPHRRPPSMRGVPRLASALALASAALAAVPAAALQSECYTLVPGVTLFYDGAAHYDPGTSLCAESPAARWLYDEFKRSRTRGLRAVRTSRDGWLDEYDTNSPVKLTINENRQLVDAGGRVRCQVPPRQYEIQRGFQPGTKTVRYVLDPNLDWVVFTAMREAIDRWNAVLPSGMPRLVASTVKADGRGMVNISVRPAPQGSCGSLTASACAHPWAGTDAHSIGGPIDWIDNPGPFEYSTIVKTAMHEIGHTLGMDHTDTALNGPSIMNQLTEPGASRPDNITFCDALGALPQR